MTNPCPHARLVDISAARDTYDSALCNDCGAVITTPRGLPKEAPMTHTEYLHALGVVELDDDVRLEVDHHNGRVRVTERRPYHWTVRFAGITPDQAAAFASALLRAANKARNTDTTPDAMRSHHDD